MDNPLIAKAFDKLVKSKFNVYNSLFLNLPYPNISNTGMLIPLLYNACKSGLEEGKEPVEILDSFLQLHAPACTEDEKIAFMFRVIQYVERQVVLFDSVEDAAFKQFLELDNNLSLKDYLHLLNNKMDKSMVAEKLSSFSTRIVFTAHPTQFYPPSVLNIIAKLKSLITQNDINQTDLKLQQLGLTSLINSQKPSPLDEAKNIIYFLRNVYYDAMGELYASIKNNFSEGHFDHPDIVQFGFWPGGDRDGNPFVTADITMAVADELRMNLMKCYYQDLKRLEKKLSFKGVENEIAGLKNQLYLTLFDPEKTISYDNIIQPLYRIHDALAQNYRSLYIEDLDKLIDKVKIFRTHFAALDIRQNHSVHKQAVETILQKEKLIGSSVDELKDDELMPLLLQSSIKVKAEDYQDELLKETFLNISQLRRIQQKNGEKGCNRYIISNSEDQYAVLFVYSLLKWCSPEAETGSFDIVPLFESMEGMTNAPQIMHTLFSIPAYRQHLQQRNNVQTIMLGFSDGTKDGGYLLANWSIFQTKENLTEVCQQHGIKAIFFDGRGGPPARGGGKTHRFYASQSKRIAGNALQLTIQGQTITSRFGTKEHFTYNYEQLLTAGIAHHLSEKENVISDRARELLGRLAQLSYQKYASLKHHPMFIPYLENKSTLRYYAQANIGSRPSKRGNKEKLELKDLRAISFVGSWSQLKQNVPGYYGIGTAIQTLVNEGQLTELQQLFDEVPFFKALMLNSMMSLSKCNFDLTAYIAKDPQYKDFWHLLLEEYRLSTEMVLLISQYQELMQEEPATKKSIAMREQIVLPLLLIQQYALQKVEAKHSQSLAFEKMVQRSLYGNINASRNSA